jgi:anti-anti-sigma factor
MADTLDIERKLLRKGSVLITLRGIVDAQTFEKLEIETQQVFQRGGYRLILDVHDLQYISSAGIGVLMNAMAECHAHQGDLYLVRMPHVIREIFDSLSLAAVFKVAPTADDALAQMLERP